MSSADVKELEEILWSEVGSREEYVAEYEKNPNVSLIDIVDKYKIVEINVVSSDGIIQKSTENDSINYDMNSKEQSKEFVDTLKVQDSFVQKYSPRGKDGSVWRKYAAINLTKTSLASPCEPNSI